MLYALNYTDELENEIATAVEVARTDWLQWRRHTVRRLRGCTDHLRGRGSVTDRRSREDEREKPSREEETQRLEDKERRSDELQEAWRRNHPSEEEEGRQSR